MFVDVAGWACICLCPWRIQGKDMRRRRGNRSCSFQGCSTSTVVALVDRCVTVAFQPFVALLNLTKAPSFFQIK